MVEHSGLDIMCPNKYCHSSVSSSSSERDKRMFTRIRLSLSADYPKKNAEILSGQYGTNLLLIGSALMLAIANHGPAVREEHLLSFLCGLMALQLAWMMWYILVRDRHESAHTEKDKHATTCWIRGGLTLLALLSLVMDAFRIGYYVGYHLCVSAVLGVYPVLHAAHTIAQVHFLWFHIKDVIKSFETFERFGVMHAVFTNLLLWCSGVMSEAEHFLKNHVRRVSVENQGNYSTEYSEPSCNCSTSTCSLFANSLFYLYPFNIEYHIFVSAMLFVMWKNIGRTLELHSTRRRPIPVSRALSLGPVLGLLALASTITVLVVYLTHVEQSMETRQAAVSMFYMYGIVMLLSMCSAAAVGLLIYRAQHCPFDTSKNPSRELDTQLALGSSVGSWLMAWCSVASVVSSSSSAPHRWTNGLYSLLMVLEKYVQNLFIIESLYRQEEQELPASPEVFSVTSSLAPPYGGIINCAYETQERGVEEGEDSAVVYGRKPSQVPLSVGTNLPPPPRLKRKLLKNIALFLTMCNICLWILPAFGCRPQYDNGLEEETFGFEIWTTVLNFAVPLNLFYRMHAVASLFEVFRRV
ncbi:LOW QUALITY PROTEIN: proton channel OTOP1 [Periophthalmus magnuspinnatus]|uniref:LOW QUALITY PROTEIN: proton channel OTOP1 n=1 Tax=Periophthalmus magnuspinnatus TaxID=409849 RepID=UPI002436CA51|nr:LOW QUALITY PROTEIN: proton channel OTOP1 [Periophthalmus magnuspinnatus]